jgi:valyl-tRNA synthetase
MAAPGTDIILSDDKLASARNFANKIWNAARFLFVNLDKFEQAGAKIDELASPEVRERAPHKFEGTVPLVDQWLYSRLSATIETVNEALKNYRFHEAAQNVYQFFWGDFCDWYIEWVKPELQSADRERATVAWKNLFAAFDAALRLLHPLMPFLTEELWHQLPQRSGARSIALDRFPEARAEWKNPVALEEFDILQKVIGGLRDIRAQLKLEPRRKVVADCFIQNPPARDLIKANKAHIERLAILSELHLVSASLDPTSGVMRSTALFELRISYEEGIDKSVEIARLKKEIDRLEKDIQAKQERHGDLDFRNKAPQHVVENLRVTMVENQLKQEKLKAQLEQLEGTQTVGN